MTARNKSLGEIVRDECRATALALGVLKFGRVEEYDADKRRAKVQVLWDTIYTSSEGGEAASRPPPIPDVPIMWPSFGGFRIRGTLVPGDVLGLIPADRALDRLISQEVTDERPIESVDPADARAHDMSDAVGLPWCWPHQVGQGATTGEIVLEHLSGAFTIRIGADGAVTFGLGGEANQPAVRGAVLAAHLTATQIWGATHVHPYAPPASATGPAAAAPPTVPADLLSALLRLR